VKIQKKFEKTFIPHFNLQKRGWKPLKSLETWPKITLKVFGLGENGREWKRIGFKDV
jgi:hypothetical protein